jgi:hypothetical protein
MSPHSRGRHQPPDPPARTAGKYFTDGARLLHVLPLGRRRRDVVAVEDCHTLEVSVASIADVTRLRLRRVASSAHQP